MPFKTRTYRRDRSQERERERGRETERKEGESKAGRFSPPQHRFGEDKRPRAQDRDYTSSETSTFVQPRFNSETLAFFTDKMHCNPGFFRFWYAPEKYLNANNRGKNVISIRNIGKTMDENGTILWITKIKKVNRYLKARWMFAKMKTYFH